MKKGDLEKIYKMKNSLLPDWANKLKELAAANKKSCMLKRGEKNGRKEIL